MKTKRFVDTNNDDWYIDFGIEEIEKPMVQSGLFERDQDNILIIHTDLKKLEIF